MSGPADQRPGYLSSNNAALQAGAQQVADGVLASANSTLMEGGLIDTPMTWDNYASVIDEVLTMNEKTLAAARKKMVRTVWEQEPSFKASQLDIACISPQPRPTTTWKLLCG